MTEILLTGSKYLIIILFAYFTYISFRVQRDAPEEKKKGSYILQRVFLLLIHALAYLCICVNIIQNPDIGLTAELGYGGTITYGKAMPVRVRIENFGADLEGKIGINAYASALAYNRYEMNISVPSGAEMEYVLPFSVLTS